MMLVEAHSGQRGTALRDNFEIRLRHCALGIQTSIIFKEYEDNNSSLNCVRMYFIYHTQFAYLNSLKLVRQVGRKLGQLSSHSHAPQLAPVQHNIVKLASSLATSPNKLRVKGSG
jgi:hypothetical protein